MELTGYLDFWFKDLPLVQRVEKFVDLGVRRLDVWCWRAAPMTELASECQRHGAILNSTFDEEMGSLADPAVVDPLAVDAAAAVADVVEDSEEESAAPPVAHLSCDGSPLIRFAT